MKLMYNNPYSLVLDILCIIVIGVGIYAGIYGHQTHQTEVMILGPIASSFAAMPIFVRRAL